MSEIWTNATCIQQAILRLHEHSNLLQCTPEEIQDNLEDMPFRRHIIESAQEQYDSSDKKGKIACYSECVEQAKLMILNRSQVKLPADFDAKECHIQDRLQIPFRKSVIKLALFDIYSKS